MSVRSVFTERKLPFVFALSGLLLFAVVILITINTSTTRLSFISSLSDLQRYYSSSALEPPPPPQPRPPLPQNVTVFSPGSRNDALSFEKIPTLINAHDDAGDDGEADLDDGNGGLSVKWERCKGTVAVDIIPCLDNMLAIKRLKSRRHMEHRERHCPKPTPKCLVPLPKWYKIPLPWPKSRDMIWYDNVPHPKLVEYKKDQNWVRKSGQYLVFPGGGTQFKDGVTNYIDFLQKTLPVIKWGKNIRVVLDVGCGVASFGGYLMERGVITMSFAPKDEHEAQIQFALERGLPATLAVIGTQKLTFPSNAYDLIHCSRCRVHWDANGGKPLLELNRLLRPGGFFVWSATPVYQHDERHRNVWNSMVSLTKSMCWKAVAKTRFGRVGFVIYQKPDSNSCYEEHEDNNIPLCDEEDNQNPSWYVPLSGCLSRLPVDSKGKFRNWPLPWPQRLRNKPLSLSTNAEELFYEDTKHWAALVLDIYLDRLAINWSKVRNVMDMNAGYGGFAAALIDLPLWVMNVIPIDSQDTLSIIFDRGLIGIYHDWCESFSTYPRSYDLLHSSFLFSNLTQRCDLLVVIAEMDRILRPGGYVLIQDTMEMMKKLRPILESLRWSVNFYQGQFLVGKKSFWRPQAT
ncbi:probable methyltransferase PMT22 [Carica papaya]|uniref:probable methyltransferase PMT22 n=1 Tax=Carica papaya TaxID=3649 RepID=UPI000B8CD4A2|nr:probable methyltransferase PMT22 [Carica papaya]